MTLSNDSDPIFLQEAINVINNVQNNSSTVMSTVIRTTITGGTHSLYHHSLLSLLFCLFLYRVSTKILLLSCY